MAPTGPGTCAVCHSPATIDEPREDWLGVEGCGCQGFFVSRWLWAGWLRHMGKHDRQKLGARIQRWRATGHAAWVFTEPGPEGRVVISDACPPRRAR